jgi:hypothetical protein
VLYAADFPYTAYTNLSFIVTSVTNSQVTDLSSNGLALFSQDSNRLADGWTQCIACAAVDRSLSRVGWSRPEACEKCFKKYCWDRRWYSIRASRGPSGTPPCSIESVDQIGVGMGQVSEVFWSPQTSSCVIMYSSSHRRKPTPRQSMSDTSHISGGGPDWAETVHPHPLTS